MTVVPFPSPTGATPRVGSDITPEQRSRAVRVASFAAKRAFRSLGQNPTEGDDCSDEDIAELHSPMKKMMMPDRRASDTSTRYPVFSDAVLSSTSIEYPHEAAETPLHDATGRRKGFDLSALPSQIFEEHEAETPLHDATGRRKGFDLSALQFGQLPTFEENANATETPLHDATGRRKAFDLSALQLPIFEEREMLPQFRIKVQGKAARIASVTARRAIRAAKLSPTTPEPTAASSAVIESRFGNLPLFDNMSNDSAKSSNKTVFASPRVRTHPKSGKTEIDCKLRTVVANPLFFKKQQGLVLLDIPSKEQRGDGSPSCHADDERSPQMHIEREKKRGSISIRLSFEEMSIAAE